MSAQRSKTTPVLVRMQLLVRIETSVSLLVGLTGCGTSAQPTTARPEPTSVLQPNWPDEVHGGRSPGTRNLVVHEPDEVGPYHVGEWRHWVDIDGDCRDTRSNVLIARSREQVTFMTDAKCEVDTGSWTDAHTGEKLTDARIVSVVHIVPLREAHDSGGSRWSGYQREIFANDPRNLMIVRRPTEFGSQTAPPWLAALRADEDVCWHVQRWIDIKDLYGLSVDQAEFDALEEAKIECDEIEDVSFSWFEDSH